jgi:L-amino acid N-acyltransferase YncA
MIRLATADDAGQIQAIYAPNVLDPAISFETVVPDADLMRQRIVMTMQTHPWLVDVRDDRIAGYAYASPHRPRPAWRWCCETTVYIHPDFQRQGVGKRLYDALFRLLRMQNYLNALAIIMLPNPSSVRMHERCGFIQRSLYPQVAHKSGVWYDAGWWQLSLGPTPAAPSEPIPFPGLADEAVQSALR